MKAFNRNDKNVKDQILQYFQAIDVDKLLTIEVVGSSPSFEIVISSKELNLISKKLDLAFDFYSVYVTESDTDWIRQSVSLIRKIQKLMNLENVKIVEVNDLINANMKTVGFIETNSFDRINQYEIYVEFDEIEITTDMIKSDDESVLSSSSNVRLRVTDEIESDFKKFEKLVYNLDAIYQKDVN